MSDNTPQWVVTLAKCASEDNPDKRITYGKQAITEVVEWKENTAVRFATGFVFTTSLAAFALGMIAGGLLWGC